MPRREIKSEGKDVATAIIRGLNELGRRRDQVEVTVVQEEKAGFLGLGGKPAIVHIIEKKWDSEHSSPMKPRAPKAASYGSFKGGKGGGRKRREDSRGTARRSARTRIDREPKAPKENEAQKLPSLEIQNTVIPENIKQPMARAKECLSTILEGIGTKPENLNVWWDEKQQRILLTFDCDHPAIIIGKEGKTLESIQYLITLMVSRDFDNPISVMADTQNYWRKLEDKINSEIDKAVSMLKRTKRTYRFRPMSAQMRRYIHRYLVIQTDISTASEGEGKWRKVVLKLQTNKNAKAALEAADKESFEAPLTETEAVATQETKTCDCGPDCTCGCQEGQPCTCTDESCGSENATEECASACACGCQEGEPCNCNEEAKAEEVAAAPAQEEKACDCGPDCTCGCQEGKPCTCNDDSCGSECTCGEEGKTEEPKAEEAKAEPVVAEEVTVTVTEEVISADNAGCDCVVSAETTTCECVADITSPEPEVKPANVPAAPVAPAAETAATEQAPAATEQK